MRREAEVIARLRAEFGPTLDYRRPEWSHGRLPRSAPLTGRAHVPIGDALQVAHEDAARTGRVVACLCPARTDTRWWHDKCTKGEIRLIQGRVRLTGQGGSPPFPSVVVVFGLPPRAVWWWPKDKQDEQLSLETAEGFGT